MTTKKRVRKTKAQKRVEIAKDVIAQLKAEKFEAEMGTYVHVEGDIDGTKELRDELKNVPLCTVCALGALFLSDVRKNGKCKGIDVELGENPSDGVVQHCINEHKMRDRLAKLFAPKQMALIECAFERGLDPKVLLSEAEYDGSAEFGGRYDNSEDRMVAIMRNIIRNKGTFVLPKEVRAR